MRTTKSGVGIKSKKLPNMRNINADRRNSPFNFTFGLVLLMDIVEKYTPDIIRIPSITP
jgi:hypothetical protein